MNKEEWFNKHPEKRRYYEATPYTWENKVLEECGEVIQAICKGKRFGKTVRHPKTNELNVDEILTEMEDLEVALYEYRQELEKLRGDII